MLTLTYYIDDAELWTRKLGYVEFLFKEINSEDVFLISIKVHKFFNLGGTQQSKNEVLRLFAEQVAKKKFKELIRQPYLILIGPETKIDITHMVAFHIANLILQGESV